MSLALLRLGAGMKSPFPSAFLAARVQARAEAMWTVTESVLRWDEEPSDRDAIDTQQPTTQGSSLDQEQFEALYLSEEKPLFNILYRWVWNEAEALDLVQEAFMRLWRQRQRIELELARAYVYKSALNLASNRLRTRKLWQWTGLDELFSKRDPEHELLKQEQNQRIRKAIEALPLKQRNVLLLAQFGEKSYREIAAILEIPEGTVGSRFNAARAQLEAALKDINTEV